MKRLRINNKVQALLSSCIIALKRAITKLGTLLLSWNCRVQTYNFRMILAKYLAKWFRGISLLTCTLLPLRIIIFYNHNSLQSDILILILVNHDFVFATWSIYNCDCVLHKYYCIVFVFDSTVLCSSLICVFTSGYCQLLKICAVYAISPFIWACDDFYVLRWFARSILIFMFHIAHKWSSWLLNCFKRFYAYFCQKKNKCSRWEKWYKWNCSPLVFIS